MRTPYTAQVCVSKSQREADKFIVFTEDGWFDTDKPQIIQRDDDGSLTKILTKADAYLGNKPPKTLPAIVRRQWLVAGWSAALPKD